MIGLSSYITQGIEFVRELIIKLKLENLLRKLLLYPTELRGPSAPVIIELTAKLHAFSSSLITFHHVSQFRSGKSPVTAFAFNLIKPWAHAHTTGERSNEFRDT